VNLIDEWAEQWSAMLESFENVSFVFDYGVALDALDDYSPWDKLVSANCQFGFDGSFWRFTLRTRQYLGFVLI
jgi:hypothetical protein